MNNCSSSASESPASTSASINPEDAYSILCRRLLGKPASKPRKATDFNLWAKDNKSMIDTAYVAATGGKQGRVNISLRKKLTQDLFEKQPESVKKKYSKMADKDHEKAMKEWGENVDRPIPTDPKSRQA